MITPLRPCFAVLGEVRNNKTGGGVGLGGAVRSISTLLVRKVGGNPLKHVGVFGCEQYSHHHYYCHRFFIADGNLFVGLRVPNLPQSKSSLPEFVFPGENTVLSPPLLMIG